MEKIKIIALVSQKGGVGKSSTTIMLTNYLAALKKSVLTIDTDYSNSITLYYLQNRYSMRNKGFADAVRKRNICDNIITTKRENIDIVPSSTDIERLDIKGDTTLAGLFEAEAETLKVYDYIVIDTSQGYNSIVANAIKAADLILTPFRLCQFDMVSCSTLLTKITECGKYDAWWIFFNDVNRYAQNKNSKHYQYISMCRRDYEHCLDLSIPQTAMVTNAIDRDIKITRKDNEKLYDAIRALVSVVIGSEAPEVEGF